MTPWSVRRLENLDESHIDALADVLVDCVEGGASVSFMQPFSRDRAVAFWRQVAQGVAENKRVVLVAEDAQGICGTVQLVLDLPENQPHRADVAKMLVHRRARRQGLGVALMRAAEAAARQCGRSLLVLDAVTDGDAARLYERLGWLRVGDIPDYALWPGGGLCGTTVYYRNLEEPKRVDASEQMGIVQIRPYQDSDQQALIALWREVLPDGAPHNEPARSLRNKLAVGRDLLLVAQVDAAVVGTAMGGYDGHRGWIYSVAVKPENRRQGIGGALLRRLEKDLARRGCLKVNLQILPSNAAVVAFYESLGFKVEERVSMGKRLY